MRFVSENFGDSDLARRFGVKRYPAIFVGDVLVATPKDFGFYGTGEGGGEGRYAPIRSAKAQARFREDLARMVDLVLAGRSDEARAGAARPEEGPRPALPEEPLPLIEGGTLARSDLAGRAVLVDLWATWCPPCRGALPFLADLARRRAGQLTVVAIAVESDESAVRDVAKGIAAPIRWVTGSPEVIRALGDVSGVPTLLLFDGEGEFVEGFYGAPPGIEDRVERAIAALAD